MEEVNKDRRSFVRIDKAFDVKYKFILDEETQKQGIPQEIYYGKTSNISSNGILLIGKFPKTEWLTQLLNSRANLAVSIKLPNQKQPVKAVARIAWFDMLLDKAEQTYELGLYFQEITREDQERLIKFVLDTLI